MKWIKIYEDFDYIESICNGYNITNWKINSDGLVDVAGGVNISSAKLKKFPIKFGKVVGNFFCKKSNLDSLDGSPLTIEGSFDISYNKLTSLEGCPSFISGSLHCNDNELNSLKGCPEGCEYIDCSDNLLTSLEGAPSIIDEFHCYGNKLTSFEGAPSVITYNFDCDRNEITSFKGFPKSVGTFNCFENPIYMIWTLFMDTDKIELFNEFDPIRGNDLILDRLNDFLITIGKEPVDDFCFYRDSKGYNII